MYKEIIIQLPKRSLWQSEITYFPDKHATLQTTRASHAGIHCVANLQRSSFFDTERFCWQNNLHQKKSGVSHMIAAFTAQNQSMDS